MVAPSVQVFLGQETAIDATPTWVDISTYVRLEYGVTKTRGSTRGGGAQPGTASFTLDNTDGRFTIGNTGSPLYPYVHLQSLVKILRGGQPWFIGRIQAAPLSWPSGGDEACVVMVTLADRLARFGRMSLKAFHVEEVLATRDSAGYPIGPYLTGPTGAYYPLTEQSGATQASDISGHLPPLVPVTAFGSGTLTFGSSVGMRGDGGAVFTPVGGGRCLTTQSDFMPLGIALTFSTLAGGLLYCNVHGAVTTTISVENYPTVTPGVMVRQTYLGGSSLWFFPCSVMDEAPHVLTWSMGATPVVVVDGVTLTPTASVGVGIGSSAAAGTVFLGAGLGANPFSGTLAHFAAWNNPLDATGVARIAAAFMGTTLTAQAAILKVLGWRGQAATALIDAGVTDLIPSTALGNGSLASVLSTISDSEDGTLYVDSQDRVTWRSRRAALSPSITLAAGDIDAGVTYNCDIQGCVTRVTWTQGGTSGTVDAADITTVGEISGSVTSISMAPGDGADHASMVANTSPRGPYIGSLTVDMMTALPATAAAVATAGILTKITLTGMPAQTPPSSTVLEVTGESETIRHDDWRVTYTTKPAGLGSGRDLLITDDAVYGVTDSTHRVAY